MDRSPDVGTNLVTVLVHALEACHLTCDITCYYLYGRLGHVGARVILGILDK